ncbi:MAG: B12-binding domain-containing radical SAM protein [Myxococcales bacterium]|nr:B12-binding domain-containing radical SAM protein [Myxococcales bacterium]
MVAEHHIAGPAKGTGLFLYLNLFPDGSRRAVRGHNLTVQGINANAPLGLLYLAAVAHRRGYDADLLDQQVEAFDAATVVERIRRERTRFVGLYCCHYDPLIAKVAAYVRRIKSETDAAVIVGGPSFDPLPVLQAGADAVCLGEGEATFAEFLDHLEGQLPLDRVRGIAYLPGGQVHQTAPMPLVEDLDALPFPWRKYVDRYFITGNPNCRRPMLELVGSRGCPMRCSFCGSPGFWGRSWRLRSPGNLLDEARELIDRHGARYLHFRDDLFGADPRWLDRFLDLYEAIPNRPNWSCYLHPASFGERRESYLRRLAASGLNMVVYGLQSTDAGILQGIHRRAEEPAMLAEQLRLARRLGILTFVGIIFGLPGETRETMRATERWVKKHRPDILTIMPLGLLRNSEFGERYQSTDEVTPLPPALINREIRRVTRSFYAHPRHLPRLLWYVLRKNPGWLRQALPRLRYGLQFFQFSRRDTNW